MKTVKKRTYADVTSWEIGFSYIGRPLMTTIFYLVDHLVIDTGSAHMRTDVIDLLADERPSRVVLTHCHEDHSANARAIRDRFQAEVLGHPYTVQKMASRQIILPYQRMIWGKSQRLTMKELPEIIETDNYQLKPIYTPGHSKDHTVYLDEENGRLFSGDLYLADKIKYFRADENIIDEINSLKSILTFNFEFLFCCHNPQTENVKQKLQAKLDYLEAFVGKVLSMCSEGMSEKDIIRDLSQGGDTLMRWITRGNMSFGNMVRSTIRHGATSN